MNFLSIRLYPTEAGANWELCGQTADYAAVCCRELAFNRLELREPLRFKEVEETIRFILNELLENAVKFRFGGAIEVDVAIEDGSLRCAVRNQVASTEASRLREQLPILLRRSPEEPLACTIEKKAGTGGDLRSGLGLRTILDDYCARLDWELYSLEPGCDVLTIEATVTT